MPGTSWIPSTNSSISGPSSTINQRLSPQNSAKLPVTLLWRRLSFDTFKVWEYQPDFIQVDILSLSSLFWSLFLSVQFHQLCVWSCFFPRYIMLSIRILSIAGSSWVVYLYFIIFYPWFRLELCHFLGVVSFGVGAPRSLCRPRWHRHPTSAGHSAGPEPGAPSEEKLEEAENSWNAENKD